MQQQIVFDLGWARRSAFWRFANPLSYLCRCTGPATSRREPERSNVFRTARNH